MKISVIFWDANFREHIHAVDFFGKQEFAQNQYEIIWVDFYQSNDKVKQKINNYPNAHLYTLDENISKKWHLGSCINFGIKRSVGDVLVIADADIAVEPDFISYIADAHQNRDDLALYFPRYDEPKEASCVNSRVSLSHLCRYAKLTNPTNYAGCISIRKDNLNKLYCYELHNSFSGPGANGLELYTRIRNAGLAVKWSPVKKIYHPWHSGTSESNEDMRKVLNLARHNYNWINAYAGLEQSWIIQCRSKNGETKANQKACNYYLKNMPPIQIDFYRNIVNRLESNDCLQFLKLFDFIFGELMKIIRDNRYSIDQNSNINSNSQDNLDSLSRLKSDIRYMTKESFLCELQIRLGKLESLQTRVRFLEKELSSCKNGLRNYSFLSYVRNKGRALAILPKLIKYIQFSGILKK